MTRASCRPLLLALALAATASAQSPRDSAAHRPRERLFTRSDVWIGAAFTAGTIALFPLDRDIATRVRDSALVNNRTVEETAKVIGFLGSPGPFLIGGAMYLVGRAADKPRLAHLAVHGTEAIVVGAGVAGVLKAVLGRSRPFVTADTNPADFRPLRGFTADRYQAFPSGHSTVAFSVASAVTAEMHEWYPRATWVVAPVLYGGATLVGLSRMYEDKHWASDVLMGAAIGTFAGLKTVRFTHTRAGNRIDRWLLGGDAALQLRVLPSAAGGVRLAAVTAW